LCWINFPVAELSFIDVLWVDWTAPTWFKSGCMVEFAYIYWPYLLDFLVLIVGMTTAVHAIMSKPDVRAATSWTAVVILMPLVGALLYVIFGINRVRVKRIMRRRSAAAAKIASATSKAGSKHLVNAVIPHEFASMKRLGDFVAEYPLLAGSHVKPLETGDDAYDAMLAAIDRARKWILLETYIFDADAVGKQFVEHLAAARGRGVEVRVLVDAIGSRYSRPQVGTLLDVEGIPNALFMGRVFGPHLRTANLRTHRKMLIVDGDVCYTGGMNIRASFSKITTGQTASADSHFEVRGPVVGDFAQVFAGDWLFTTDKRLPADAIMPTGEVLRGGCLARVVASGPDHEIECTHDMVMGILSIAARRVVIATPYFLPDRPLVGALAVAARRGVSVDIVLPSKSNLPFIDYAVMANLGEVVGTGCRVWQTIGPFDHSKLMAADGKWAYVGSSNLDPRSFRLNFEIDLEVYDAVLAKWVENHIDKHIANAIPLTVKRLDERKRWQQLRDRICWLGSPYM
jgi:cardiolipin synthase A/B